MRKKKRTSRVTPHRVTGPHARRTSAPRPTPDVDYKTSWAEWPSDAPGSALNSPTEKEPEMALPPPPFPTIASLLDQLDLTIDALEGRLARVLRPEREDAAPNVGYSDVARSVHSAITRLVEIAERVDV